MGPLPKMSATSWIITVFLAACTAYWIVQLVRDAMWRRKYRKGRIKLSRTELIQIFQNINCN